MPPNKCKKVRDNYPTYEMFLSKSKKVVNAVILVNKFKPQNKSYKIGISPVLHPTIKDELTFMVEMKVSNFQSFKFAIFWKDLCDSPCFRFDSDGSTHKNSDPNTPLFQQAVYTPHFHKFSTTGEEVAYQTSQLKAPKLSLPLKDIHNCVKHFCKEAKLKLKNNGYPVLSLNSDELNLIFEEEDPLKSLKFTN